MFFHCWPAYTFILFWGPSLCIWAVEEPFQRELKCLAIWQQAQKILRQASFFIIFCITHGESLLFAERLVVLFKFILLHRLEHRKNGIWGVETERGHGQTTYARRETCPRTSRLNAQLKVWSLSELFMGLIFWGGWKQREKTGLKTTRNKSADFVIFPDYFYKVSTSSGVRALVTVMHKDLAYSQSSLPPT